MSSPLVRRVAVTVKHTLAVASITSDPAEDHLVAYGTMQNIVLEGVGDVRLELYRRASRKGVPSLPAHENFKGEPTGGIITAIGRSTDLLLYNHPRATKVSNTRSAWVFVKVALRDWLSRRAAIDERQ